jgi:hypothetical protein
MAQVDPPIGAQLTQPLSSPLGCAQPVLLASAHQRERNDPITRVSRVKRFNDKVTGRAEGRRSGILAAYEGTWEKAVSLTIQGRTMEGGVWGLDQRGARKTTSDRSDIRGAWRRAYACKAHENPEIWGIESGRHKSVMFVC